MDQVVSIRSFMLLMFKASQGAIWQQVFQCLCDLPAHSVAFSDQEADGRCVELNLEEFFFCNALGLIQNPTCYGKIHPARWSRDFSCDCCWAGGWLLWISCIIPSSTGWNCLKTPLRFAQWKLGSWEDRSCWQTCNFLSSNTAIGYEFLICHVTSISSWIIATVHCQQTFARFSGQPEP